MSSAMRRVVFATVVLAALAAWTLPRLRVTTDITHFLPEGRATLDLSLARELAFGELARTMVLVVRADDPEHASVVSREFEAALRAEPRVAESAAFIEGGPPAGLERAAWELYEPRRFSFVAPDAEAARAAITDEALASAAVALRERLGTPMSGLLSRVAPEDPLLVLPRLLERLESARGTGVAVADGRFVVDGGRSAVILCGTRGPSSDNAIQRPFLAGIRAAFDRVDAAHGGRLVLEQSGANRYGLAMEDALRRDIQRVSIGSTVLVVLLFLVVFRSLRFGVFVMPILAAGFLVGTAACQALFGGVHGLTLAFGAALIGVSVDYAEHFHCHQVLAPHPDGPRATLASIWPGLLLGATTTILGFLVLIVSTFPGLRELAVFGAAGIAASLVATAILAPVMAEFIAPKQFDHGATRAIARFLARRWITRHPRVSIALTVAAALVVGFGLQRVRWDDGLAALGRLDPELQAEDEAVRARVAGFDQRHLVVAFASDEQKALEVNDRVADVLARAQEDGLVAGSWSAATLVPSAARQREVDRVLRSDPTLWDRTRAALEAQGFVSAEFAPFRDALAASPPEPLVWNDLAQSPLAPLVRPFRVEFEGLDEPNARDVGFVSFLRGTRDATELRSRLESAGARLVGIESEFSAAYGTYRRRMTELLGFGILAVVVLVAVRHAFARSRHGVLRPTILACVPALAAAITTVAALSICGLALNTLSLVALLMVASMGVDYGIFLAEPAHTREGRDATNVAVFLAALTTIFSFGLLAFSDQPSLQSLGAAAGLGVLLSYVFVFILRDLLQEPDETNP